MESSNFDTSSIRENFTKIFVGYELIAGRILEDIQIADMEKLKMDASENFHRRIKTKEGLTHKRKIIQIPNSRDTAKVSGRDCEFREPTLRREQTVGSEDLSGELQGEPEESQLTESKDDAEVRMDFWYIQSAFI